MASKSFAKQMQKFDQERSKLQSSDHRPLTRSAKRALSMEASLEGATKEKKARLSSDFTSTRQTSTTSSLNTQSHLINNGPGSTRISIRSRRSNISHDGQVQPHEKPPKIYCESCDEAVPSEYFEAYDSPCLNPHEQVLCIPHLGRRLIDAVQLKDLDLAGCPRCRSLWQTWFVKSYLSEGYFDEYMELTKEHPNYRKCLSPSCDHGQLHHYGIRSPKVVCEACGSISCFGHKVQWHENRTCAEYYDSIHQAQSEVEYNYTSIEQRKGKSKDMKPGSSEGKLVATNDPASNTDINQATKMCPDCSADMAQVFQEGLHKHKEHCKFWRYGGWDDLGEVRTSINERIAAKERAENEEQAFSESGDDELVEDDSSPLTALLAQTYASSSAAGHPIAPPPLPGFYASGTSLDAHPSLNAPLEPTTIHGVNGKLLQEEAPETASQSTKKGPAFTPQQYVPGFMTAFQTQSVASQVIGSAQNNPGKPKGSNANLGTWMSLNNLSPAPKPQLGSNQQTVSGTPGSSSSSNKMYDNSYYDALDLATPQTIMQLANKMEAKVKSSGKADPKKTGEFMPNLAKPLPSVLADNPAHDHLLVTPQAWFGVGIQPDPPPTEPNLTPYDKALLIGKQKPKPKPKPKP